MLNIINSLYDLLIDCEKSYYDLQNINQKRDIYIEYKYKINTCIDLLDKEKRDLKSYYDKVNNMLINCFYRVVNRQLVLQGGDNIKYNIKMYLIDKDLFKNVYTSFYDLYKDLIKLNKIVNSDEDIKKDLKKYVNQYKDCYINCIDLSSVNMLIDFKKIYNEIDLLFKYKEKNLLLYNNEKFKKLYLNLECEKQLIDN